MGVLPVSKVCCCLCVGVPGTPVPDSSGVLCGGLPISKVLCCLCVGVPGVPVPDSVGVLCVGVPGAPVPDSARVLCGFRCSLRQDVESVRDHDRQ